MDLKEGIPLHKQISDWIKNQIERGTLEENEKLPSENELSNKFDVSRVTVRRALQTLENDQLIYRCQGLGSFVTDQRTHQSFSILNDFTEELAGSGLKPSSKLISFEQQDISGQKDLLSYLGIQNKEIAVKIERVRLGDNSPIAYDITWMPVFYGQLIESYDLEQTTIFAILEEEFDIPIERGCYRIEATLADETLAQHLQVDQQTPLLQINRISYTIGDKPVYFQKRFYRNDKMVFELMAERHKESTGDNSEVLASKEFTPVFRDSN
ncbi:GntR family transcriptional regulator [Fodinibius halophilus]|uniref:GntR family transcriptional regulator n=1 Tax=Fodinibius halophilus TaxID=1736908 RepID=A0A6M1TBL5_9BACT|nr:GntR family transcriptional regulator [Fodinibius halophilus]NGP87682.1 GntR family transcriptional regulator [Fodinibius halophilus]